MVQLQKLHFSFNATAHLHWQYLQQSSKDWCCCWKLEAETLEIDGRLILREDMFDWFGSVGSFYTHFAHISKQKILLSKTNNNINREGRKENDERSKLNGNFWIGGGAQVQSTPKNWKNEKKRIECDFLQQKFGRKETHFFLSTILNRKFFCSFGNLWVKIKYW